MNVDYEQIEKYYENNNISVQVFIYSIVISLLLVILLLCMTCLEKNKYYDNQVIVKENKLITIVKYSDITKLLDSNKILINKKYYNYHVNNISFVDGNYNYYCVELSFDLSDNYKLENNILDYRVLISKESILKFFVRIVKGG